MNHPNTVIYGGNLTRDPELKYTPKGTAVCELSIANTEKWTSESGEAKERTCFAGATIWGKSGEVFAQYHKKGSQCLVHGRLMQESWEDKESGKKREKTKIRVDQWFFVGGKRDGERGAAPAPSQQNAPRGNVAPKVAPAAAVDDDDKLPF